MLVLLSGLATAGGLSIAQALPASELFEDLNLNELSLQTGGDRTFVSLNSTYIAYGIAAGAARGLPDPTWSCLSACRHLRFSPFFIC